MTTGHLLQFGDLLIFHRLEVDIADSSRVLDAGVCTNDHMEVCEMRAEPRILEAVRHAFPLPRTYEAMSRRRQLISLWSLGLWESATELNCVKLCLCLSF